MKHQILKRVCALLFTFIFASPLNCMELPKNQKGHDTSLTLPVTQITDEESVMVERLAELLWETEQESKADLLKVLTIHEMINVESLDIKLNRKAREAGFEFDKLFGSELFQKAYDLFLNRIFQDEDQKLAYLFHILAVLRVLDGIIQVVWQKKKGNFSLFFKNLKQIVNK